jgi:3-oxoacyl-[acyl-carrier protein] reductase
MDLGIQGRTALVLAGGGGLGGAVAATLAREGAKVAVADIDLGAAQRTVAAIVAQGGVAVPIRWDLADLDSIDGHVGTVERELGGVDILVNITGGPPPTPASGQSPKLWGDSFRSMVLSVIVIADRVLPGMRARKWGRIITSTSSGVVAPIPNLGVSNGLRQTLVGWSKTLAGEVGADGVTANIIVPGRIATPRISFLDEQKAGREQRPLQDVVAQSTGSIPLGRYGNPQEYADVVAFLASERASYLTGSLFRVDGGMLGNI